MEYSRSSEDPVALDLNRVSGQLDHVALDAEVRIAKIDSQLRTFVACVRIEVVRDFACNLQLKTA